MDSAPQRPAWLAVDATVSFTYDDVSVFAVIDELIRELRIKGVKLVLAGRRTELNRWIARNKITINDDDLIIAPDLYFVIRLYQSRQQIKKNTNSNNKSRLLKITKPLSSRIRKRVDRMNNMGFSGWIGV